MSNEIETIGLGMDTSGVEKGIKALDVLAGKGAPVEKAMAGIEGAAERTGKSLKTLGDGATKGIDEVAKRSPAAASGLKKVNEGAEAAGKSVKNMGATGAAGLDVLSKSAATASTGMRGISTASTAADKGIRGLAVAANEVTAAIRAEAAALTGLQAGVASLNAAHAAAAKSAQDFAVALRTAGEQSKKVQDGVGATTSSFAGLGGAARIAGTALAAIGIGSSVGELVKMADASTNVASRLSLVTNSASELAQVQRRLFDVAQSSRVSFVDLVGTYAQVARSTKDLGVSQTSLLGVIKTISQAVTISGGSAQSAQAALVQLSQGFAAGALRGEELNSVMEQTPRLAQAIADGLGVSIGKLREMGGAGELTAAKVLGALEKSAAKVAQEFGNMAVTVEQASTQASNSVLRLVGAFDKLSGATSFISGFITKLSQGIDFLSKDVEKLGSQGPIRAAADEVLALDRRATILRNGLRNGFYGPQFQPELDAVNTKLAEAKKRFNDLDAAMSGQNPRDQSGFTPRSVSYAKEAQRQVDLRTSVGKILGTQAGIKDSYQKDLNTLYEGFQNNVFSADATKNLEAYRKAVVQLIKDSATAKPEAGAGAALSDSLNAQVQLYKNRDQAILDGRKAFNDQLDLMVKLGATSELDALQQTLDKETEVWKSRKANFDQELAAASKKKDSQAEQQRIQGQVLDAERDHQQALAKLSADARLLDQRSLDTIDARASKEQASARSVQEQVRLARLETQAIGKTGDALGALNQARTEEIAKQLEARAATEDGIDLSGRTSKALRDQAAATRELAQVSGYNDAKKSLDDYSRAVNETAEGLQLEISLMGESETVRATAIEQFKIELRLRKQIEDIKSRTKKDSPEQKELIDEAVGIADKDKVNASQKVVLDEWKKTTDSINNSLTDALLRGFESGKGFAENLRDTLKNMFSTLVLRPIISAVLSPVSGAINGLVSGVTGGAAGGGNNLMGMASNAYSLYNGASSAYTLGSQYLGGTMSGANALGSLYANATGAGLDGLLATNAAFGTSAQSAIAANLAMEAGTAPALAAGTNAAGGAAAGSWGAGGIAALIMLAVINALGGMRTETQIGSGLAGTLGGSSPLTPWQEWREGGTLFDGPMFATHNPLEELSYRRNQLQQLRDSGQGESNLAVAIQANVTDLEKTTKGLATQTEVFNREIGKGYKAYRENVVDMANTLGLAGDSVKDFAYTLGAQDLNFQGLNPEQIQAKIAETFGKAGTEMAQQLLGSFKEVTDTVVNTYVTEQMTQASDGAFVTDTTVTKRMEYQASIYAKTGETAIQTLTRLSTSFNTLNEAADALGFGIQKGSLSLADFSDKFIEAFGGPERFTASTSAFLQNYYTDGDRREYLIRSGVRQAEKLGIKGLTEDNLRNGSREQLRDFVNTAASNPELYADALDLANYLSPIFGAFEDQAPVVQEVANVVDELTQSYQNAIKSLTGDRDSLAVEVLRAQGDEAGAKALERSQYLAQFAGLDEARRKEIETLYDGNVATRKYIQGIKDAAQAQLDALAKLRSDSLALIDTAAGKTDAALAAYERAADKERERLQGSIDSIKAVFQAAEDGAKSFFSEVEAVAKFQGAEGRDFITQALVSVQAGGALPDGKELSDAIAAVGKDFSTTQYASQAEADFQRLVVANELKGLKVASGNQLDTAEQQLDALNDQVEYARDQVNLLRGIDSSLKDLPTALANLIAAYNDESRTRSNVAAKAIIGTGSAIYDKTSSTGLTSSGAFFDAADMAEAARAVIAANGAAGKASVLDALEGKGYTMPQYNEIFGLPPGTLEAEARALGKPIYHNGTTRVPETGFALLQKDEAVIPAAFNPWVNGGAGGSNNAEVVAELRAVKAELLEIRRQNDAMGYQAKRTADATNGQGEAPMLTEAT